MDEPSMASFTCGGAIAIDTTLLGEDGDNMRVSAPVGIYWKNDNDSHAHRPWVDLVIPTKKSSAG